MHKPYVVILYMYLQDACLHIGSLFTDTVNDYVGFGLMDASKMVDAALKWKRVPNVTVCTIPGPRVNRYDAKL